MTSLRLLPPVPQAPHDPQSLTLDAARGWRNSALDGVRIDPVAGALTLATLDGSLPLDDPFGSLGGLVPPALVALDECGDVWLLDDDSATLRKLDDCACAFVAVPHLGSLGSGARQFDHPLGLAATHGNLFVADSGNARVSVFATRGYVLRGTLSLPVGMFSQPLAPVAVRTDPRGRIYVADPANGCVHRFNAALAWDLGLRNVGDVRRIAVDARGWLYAGVSTSAVVRVFDGEGHERDPVTDADAVRGRFPPLPFRVDASGALDFGASSGACRAAFDSHGALLPQGAKPAAIKLQGDGSFRSAALDSAIAQCQWHRVLLCGALPAGTSVTVLTRTSDVDEPDDIVAALPDAAWQTLQTARRAPGSDGACVAWDCLVRSGPGRFLWLRLRLRGDGRATPALTRATLEMPRVSLARWLPAAFREDPAASDFTHRFLALFDTTLRSIEGQLDGQAALFDARSAPATPGATGSPDFLSWLASWVGLALDRHWPEARRRRFLREAPALFDHRGTTRGLRDVLLLYLGLSDTDLAPCATAPVPRGCGAPNRCAPLVDPCAEPAALPPTRLPPLLLEHWRLRRWLYVGSARLGEESMLWGKAIVNRSRLGDGARADVTRLITEQDPYRDPFHVYASTYTVFVPACFARDATARKGLTNLLRDESPAHTRWHLELVEPRFRIGVQSMIGFDAVVGRWPTPAVTLDSSALGRSTILGGPPDAGRGPSLRVGSSARVGSTTALG